MTTNQYFKYQDGTLCAEDVALDQVAQQFGTPLYVYSRAAFTGHFREYYDTCQKFQSDKIDALVCYSVKSNSNISVLKVLGQAGAGFDIVSGGELARVIAAGCDAKKVIFSGVGKSRAEIALALQHDIRCFNVESFAELERINQVAGEMGKKARISFRVNPNVDPKTHPYISTGLKENKFGIAYEDALESYLAAARMPNIAVTGIDCHIGSQLVDDAPLLEALDKLFVLMEQLKAKGIMLSHLDIGGGIGIIYNDEKPVAIADYLERLFAKVIRWREEQYPEQALTVMFEPGRSISGNAGVLLSQVQYLKSNGDKHFAVVDAAMNDLMRPSLYEAWHSILPVKQLSRENREYDVVGPICESGDWLAKRRPLAVAADDYVAIMSAGAYGMSMSSNYNTRGRSAEVLVDGNKVTLIRRRETPADLYALETLID